MDGKCPDFNPKNPKPYMDHKHSGSGEAPPVATPKRESESTSKKRK
jgi:hypothetical protein